YRGLAEHRDTLTFIYDTLIQDHLTMDRLRKYPDPMLERHLVNEIDADAVGKNLTPFTFSEAQKIILEAFNAFSPVFREIAGEFFAKRWIDAEIRKGKRGGAFCASPSPGLHPYILCNYTDNLRDVMTVAHELGHGLHGSLSRKQSYFNYDTPLTTAETASVFGEMLVFDYLVERQSDPKVQIALLAGKLEDAFATVFRQNVL